MRRFFEQYCTYGVFGYEEAETGTPHLQGYLVLKQRNRVEWLKKRTAREIHWQAARGTHEQAANYCKKDGSFVEHGTIPIEDNTLRKLKGDDRWRKMIELAKWEAFSF